MEARALGAAHGGNIQVMSDIINRIRKFFSGPPDTTEEFGVLCCAFANTNRCCRYYPPVGECQVRTCIFCKKKPMECEYFELPRCEFDVEHFPDHEWQLVACEKYKYKCKRCGKTK